MILRDFPTIIKNYVGNHTVHILHSEIMSPPYAARFVLALWNRLDQKISHCIKRGNSHIVMIQGAPYALKVAIFLHQMNSINLSCRVRPDVDRNTQRARNTFHVCPDGLSRSVTLFITR